MWSTSSGTATAVGSTSGAASATLLAGPDGTSTKQVTAINIYNADTAAVTVTLRKTVSGTNYILAKQSIPVGSTLIWSERLGLVVSAPSSVSNTGTVAGTGVTVSEQGNGVVQKSVFTFSSATITVRDTQQGNGVNIYNFPEGRIFILGATGSMNFTTTSVLASTLHASVSCRWGVGTVTQSNATLATTEQDLIPVTTFTSGATINVANTATSASLATAAQFDGTATAKKAFMNVSVPTGTDIDADAAVLMNGTVTITWIFLGDY